MKKAKGESFVISVSSGIVMHCMAGFFAVSRCAITFNAQIKQRNGVAGTGAHSEEG